MHVVLMAGVPVVCVADPRESSGKMIWLMEGFAAPSFVVVPRQFAVAGQPVSTTRIAITLLQHC
jgi:hypothetical protein